MPKFKTIAKSLLRSLDIALVKYSTLEKLRVIESAGDGIELLSRLPSEHSVQLLEYWARSRSQLRQDLLVLSLMNFKRDGFFVEFGATNGLDLSNTHLLEKDFGWTGILAEPAVCWHRDLKRNRNAHIETRCVWKYSNASLAFNETEMEELSTLAEFSSTDAYGELRKKGRTYNVDTISLNDLLTKYGAPIDIDYLSIDTEGSEFEILKNFDFSMHQFKVITCEHNFTPVRSQLFELLTRNGYVRKFEDLSRFDDWYVRAG